MHKPTPSARPPKALEVVVGIINPMVFLRIVLAAVAVLSGRQAPRASCGQFRGKGRSGPMRVAALVVACTTFAGVVSAQGLAFSRFVSGGGGGQDPQKQRLARSMGGYICLHVAPGKAAGTVNFTIVSQIPQPASRIGDVAIDLGRHGGLIRRAEPLVTSPGVKASVVPPQPHPFLAGLTPEFWIKLPHLGPHKPDGFSPGRMIVLAATLGDGKSIHDVYAALQEGMNPATAAGGLRVGVLVLYLLGGPPPGVATIQDDGGFVLAAGPNACR